MRNALSKCSTVVCRGLFALIAVVALGVPVFAQGDPPPTPDINSLLEDGFTTLATAVTTIVTVALAYKVIKMCLGWFNRARG
jgi:hypothetical protein